MGRLRRKSIARFGREFAEKSNEEDKKNRSKIKREERSYLENRTEAWRKWEASS